MKLCDALDLGKECGLETVSEAITNIEIHGISLFLYIEMNKEYDELYAELEDYIKIGGSLQESINNALKRLNGEKPNEKVIK